MKVLGRHLIVEYASCDSDKLNNLEYLETIMNEAVRKSGATIVRSVFHRYNPQGVSGVVVIAESHFSIHTWPEYGYAAIDYFTCGESVDPTRARDYVAEQLGAGEVVCKEFERGIPSDVHEVISHKNFETVPIKVGPAR